MSLTKLSLALLGVAIASQSFANGNIAKQQCLSLTSPSPQVRLTQVAWSEDGIIPADPMSAFTGGSVKPQQAAVHCVVEGIIEERIGADGKPYGTQFQLRLPQDWNKKFLFQGGGGTDGFVAPAVGNIPFNQTTAIPALMRGYAVVSMNGGHSGLTADFGADQQARLDFAYQAIGKVNNVAKQLIYQLYQDNPKDNIFMGCSNGGREAMIALQRYPMEFNGIIAGNPGFRLSRAAIAQRWDLTQLLKYAPTNAQGEKILANTLTQQDLDKVSQAVLKQCDNKDGLADGLINAWERCDFNPEQLDLPASKIAALKAVFEGAKDSQGQAIYSGWYYDSGINQAGWRMWKLGDSQTAQANALNATLGAESLKKYFMTPYSPDFDLSQFDFDRDTAKTAQTAAINDAISTDLTTFAQNGGKFIVITGVSDPVFSAKDQVAWFKQLSQDTPNTPDFARLFVVPGMTHCGGGNALDDFDPLTALENWREQGQAPNYLLAKGKAFPNKQMPICAYPKIATYIGGDENQASSFECR